jgi:hypothetical protein
MDRLLNLMKGEQSQLLLVQPKTYINSVLT